MAEPRVLYWDIETAHNVAAVFRLFDQYDAISHENLLAERYMICACWKWDGGTQIKSVSVLDDPKRFAKDPNDDYHVCKVLHEVLSSADVIVAHNGDQYDIKFAQTRMLAHGFQPLPPIMSIDTLKIAREKFLFNSNRLDYLGRYLKLGKKLDTEKGLWLKALAGDKTAIKKMVVYNKQDVVLLEKVFKKLQPYVANHVNRQMWGLDGCPRCGSHNVQSRGVHRSLTQVYQRFQCQNCSGWFRCRKASDKASLHRVL